MSTSSAASEVLPRARSRKPRFDKVGAGQVLELFGQGHGASMTNRSSHQGKYRLRPTAGYGLQTRQGRWPALSAARRVGTPWRFLRLIRRAHLQSGR